MPFRPLETDRMWKRGPVSPECPVQQRTTIAHTWQPLPRASLWKQSRTFCEHRYLLRWDEMEDRKYDARPSPNTRANGDGLSESRVIKPQISLIVCFNLVGATDGWDLHSLDNLLSTGSQSWVEESLFGISCRKFTSLFERLNSRCPQWVKKHQEQKSRSFSLPFKLTCVIAFT